MSLSDNNAASKYVKECPECGDESEAMIQTTTNVNSPGVWVRCRCGALTWAHKTTN